MSVLHYSKEIFAIFDVLFLEPCGFLVNCWTSACVVKSDVVSFRGVAPRNFVDAYQISEEITALQPWRWRRQVPPEFYRVITQYTRILPFYVFVYIVTCKGVCLTYKTGSGLDD
jgi:hypothetical protein